MAARSSGVIKIKNATAKKPVVSTTTPKKKATKKTSAPQPIPAIVAKQTLAPIIKRNPLGHLLIEKMFREAGFRGGVSSNKQVLERYSTDESIFSIRPQVVIQPKNKSDVEIATRVIARETKRFSSLSHAPGRWYRSLWWITHRLHSH